MMWVRDLIGVRGVTFMHHRGVGRYGKASQHGLSDEIDFKFSLNRGLMQPDREQSSCFKPALFQRVI